MLLIVPVLGSLSGCMQGQDCTDIGWREGFALKVQAQSGTLPAGRYQIAIVADGATVTHDLPSTAGACANGACFLSAPASGGRTLRSAVLPILEANDTVRWFELQIYFTDGDGNAGGPRDIQVRMDVGGATLLDKTYTPQYERDELNGDGCGVATRASAIEKL